MINSSSQFIRSIKKASFGCLFVFAWSFVQNSVAQSIEELELFDFGTIAIPDNGSESVLYFPRSLRNSSVSGSLAVVSVGTPGRYRLSGLTPSTSVEVTIETDLLVNELADASRTLSVTSYDLDDRFVTNVFGELELQIGGTLETSGTGGTYPDGPYSATTRLLATYWVPNAGQYVTDVFNIDMLVQVKTSFSLKESVGLSFGTLFARSAFEDQASLTLAPDGKFTFSNPGKTRLVILSKPQPGIIVVSGAAPNQSVNIELPTADVLLKSSRNPNGPHFIVSQFASIPERVGKTNQEGLLEIQVGATLSTQSTDGVSVYPAGTYEGVYELRVSY